MKRRILLTVVQRDSERCLIDAPTNQTVAFQGDSVDAPTLCCGQCEAELVIGIDRPRLTNMVIQCKRCGSCNDTRQPNTGYFQQNLSKNRAR
jgi:hypothetical protein